MAGLMLSHRRDLGGYQGGGYRRDGLVRRGAPPLGGLQGERARHAPGRDRIRQGLAELEQAMSGADGIWGRQTMAGLGAGSLGAGDRHLFGSSVASAFRPGPLERAALSISMSWTAA